MRENLVLNICHIIANFVTVGTWGDQTKELYKVFLQGLEINKNHQNISVMKFQTKEKTWQREKR